MFHGTLVRHFVPPNRTEHTRVSLDFRIGVGQYFDPGWRPNLRRMHRADERGKMP